MRNLNECQAEVFRRSEKRIKARKKRRNHILMACIPLVLCITLFSAFILIHAKSKEPVAKDGVTEPAVGGLTCAVARIEVSGIGVSKIYTEPSDVLVISDRLYSYTEHNAEYNYSGAQDPDGEANENVKAEVDDDNVLGGSTADSSGIGYRITLVMREGGSTEYYLTGNTLVNRAGNQTYTLTQSELYEMKDLLGIPK